MDDTSIQGKLDSNREKRKAALTRVLARRDNIIIPSEPVFLVEFDPADLLETVERGYIESKVLNPLK